MIVWGEACLSIGRVRVPRSSRMVSSETCNVRRGSSLLFYWILVPTNSGGDRDADELW